MSARWQLQAISGAVDGFDETRLTRVWLKLCAQVSDVNTDGLNIIIGLIAPHLFEDQGRGNGLPMALQQTMEQLKFKMGQTHRQIEPDGFKSFWHEGQWSVAEYFVMVATADMNPVAATQQGFNASLKFFEIERFGEVVVGA